MTKSALFAIVLLTAGAAFVQPTLAASEEPAPAPGASETAKPAKPAKHKAHRHAPKHERHSSVMKAHKPG